MGQSSRAINCLFASNQTSRYEYSSPAARGTCLTSCKSAMHLLHLCMGGFQVLTSARLLRSYNALFRDGRQQLATAYIREKNNFQFLRKRRGDVSFSSIVPWTERYCNHMQSHSFKANTMLICGVPQLLLNVVHALRKGGMMSITFCLVTRT